MREAIRSAVSKDNKYKFTVIKSGTGTGKTEAYLDYIIDLDNYCIATKTHMLGDEIFNRYIVKSNNVCDIVKTYKLDSKYDCSEEYYHYMKIGLYDKAKNILRNYIKHPKESETYLQNAKLVLNSHEKIKNSTKIIVTHAGLINLDNENVKTVIIDEDILLSLITTFEYKKEDFEILLSYCYGDSFESDLNSFIEFIDEAEFDKVISTPIFGSNLNDLDDLIADVKTRISSNIYDCITSEYFIKYKDKEGNATITMIKSNLGEIFSKKYKFIILSATANEDIYKSVFGTDNVSFIDCGLVKPKGKIYLHPKYTMSRSCLANEKNQNDIMSYIEDQTNTKYPTITFKSFKNPFTKQGINVVNNFGSTVGLDNLGGKEINIIGTPHLSKQLYSLYASVLLGNTQELNRGQIKNMALRTIKRYGYEFKFYTYSNDNSIMQNLQFYLIESEYFQAIGRARANREENAVVHVFSNLPVPFCELAIDCNEEDLLIDKEEPENEKEAAA